MLPIDYPLFLRISISFGCASRKETVLLAAIKFMLEPLDVIPDHDLLEGYNDDAVAFNYCLRKMNPATRARIEKLTSLIGA